MGEGHNFLVELYLSLVPPPPLPAKKLKNDRSLINHGI